MAMMPGAVNRLLSNQARQGPMKSYQGVCLHTMVGTLAGTDSMFRSGGTVGTESHFGVGENGEIYQWVDTRYTADANYLGSGHVISIETADYGGSFGRWNTAGDNVPYWNEKQLAAIVRIIVWACETHDIPIRQMKDVTDRGIGYHAMGVPGNELPSRLQGTRYQWSKARGKVCPGRRRISQVPEVVRRAQQGGGSSSNSNSNDTKGLFGMAVQKPLTRQKDLKLPLRKWKTVPVDDKGNTSILFDLEPGDGAMINAHLDLDGVPVGANVQVRFYTVSYRKGTKTRRLWSHYRAEVVGTAGRTYAVVPFLRRNTSKAAEGRSIRIRCEIRAFQKGVTLKRAQFNRAKG